MNDLNQVGTYKQSPYAAQNLALAQNLYNSRSAGMVNAEQGILTNQANAVAGTERNATDASQALAVNAAIAGQGNSQFANLAAQESMDRMQKAGMLNNAYGTMINEGDKEFQDQLRMLQQKIGIRGVAAENQQNAMNGLGNTAAMFGNMWDSGAFKKGGNTGGVGALFGSMGAKH